MRLGDLVQVEHGWAFKSEFFSEEQEGNPIVVNIGNFRYTGGFRFGETRVRGYSADYPPEYELEPGETLLVMTCQTPGGEILGIPGRTPDDGQVYLHNQRLGKVVVRDATKVSADYLYWVYLWPVFNRALYMTASGTKILHTSPSRIEAFEFWLPPLPEQRAIAHILGTLDDKIELNRQMNQTLEAIARAIFKSWFVDFDPVWAKAEGRDPVGMDAATAALFPDRFVESELGLIPAGWEVVPLPEAIEVDPYRELIRDREIPYLPMANVPTDSAFPETWETREYRSGARFINGDTLFARITPCLENGKTAFVMSLEVDQIAWGSTEYIVLRSKPPLPLEFSYFLARTSQLRAFAIANMTGTSGRQRVPKDCFDSYMIAVPSPGIAARFGQLASTQMVKMLHNIAESRALADLRDTLLPKLISGELRVGDDFAVPEVRA